MKILKLSKRSKKRNKGANVNGDNFLRFKQISIVAGSATRRINTPTTLVARQGSVGLVSDYGLGTAGTNSFDFLSAAIANQEFTSLQGEYRFVRFLGVEVVVNPSTNLQALTSPAVIYLPPAFFVVNAGYTGSLNAANIARADSALEVGLVNTSGIPSKLRYNFPAIMTGTNGYPIGGTGVYMASQAWSGTPNFTLLMGYLQSPTWTGTGNQSMIVASVDVYSIVEFAGKIDF